MTLYQEQTRSFARSKFKTTQMDQLEEVEDIKENDLNLLMKHLNRLGKKSTVKSLTTLVRGLLAQDSLAGPDRPRTGNMTNVLFSTGTKTLGYIQYR